MRTSSNGSTTPGGAAGGAGSVSPSPARRSSIAPTGASLSRADEARQERPDLDRARSGRDHWVLDGVSADLVLAVGLEHAEAPGALAVHDRPEHDHPARLDEGLPVRRVAAHDL